MATQKVPLTRIDEAGASEGKVLKYSSGALAWGDDASGGGGGGGGSGTAFKNTILGTESVSANSLEQYQVHSGLEILSGGTFTINPSGDLVLDAPDDPNKAAGWTDSGLHIATTDTRDSVCIGTHTPLSADDKLSVAGGNLTVAGSISAQGNVYGNAANMANTGKILQVVTGTQSTPTTHSAAGSYVTTNLLADITLSNASNLVLVSFHLHIKEATGSNNQYRGFPTAIYRTKDGGSAANIADGGPGSQISSYSNESYNTLVSWSYTDTPAPSNIGTAVRYEIFFKTMNPYASTVTHTAGLGASNATSQITLMEIAG